MENLVNILDALDALNKSSVVDVYVPSANKVVKFKPLSTQQQKELLKTTLNRSSGSLVFNNTLNAVLIENCLDKTLKLLTTDKTYIASCLRVASLTGKIKFGSKEYNLEDCIKKTLETTSTLRQTSFSHNDIVVFVSIPDLLLENELNLEALKRFDNESTTTDTLKTAFGELYIGEIVKHVSKIEFTFNGKTEVIEFNNTISYIKKTQIIERLPVILSKQVVDYIDSLREEELRFVGGREANPDFSLDVTFFTP